MMGLAHDVRYALRGLINSPVFTFTTAITLAVCIGANTALFAVVDHVLLRPLRVPDSDRIVLIYNAYPKAGVQRAGATVPDYFDRRQGMTAFEVQALFNTRRPALDVNRQPEQIHAMQVTPSFFRLVGVQPQEGRAFIDEEGEIAKNRVVILSDALRQRLFGGRNAIAQTVKLDGVLHTVVGVMPAGFTFIEDDIQAWVPLAFTDRDKTQRYSNNWAYLGRLKRDTRLADAQAQLDRLNAENLVRYPDTKSVILQTGHHSVAVRLQDDLVRDVRPTLQLLWGGALLVLLIGCVNVASLVLVRSRLRLREFATRLALGASRVQIVRQLAIEYTLLTVGSAVAGLAIGYAALQLFAINLQELPNSPAVRIDGRIIRFVIGLSVLIGSLLGAVPLLGGLPAAVNTVLRDEGRTGTGGRRATNARRVFVVAQVAVAFVLLVASGLILESFRRVLTIDPGFESNGLLTASVNLPQSRYANSAAIRRFTDDALQTLRVIPGVAVVGATTSIPFSDDFSVDVKLPEGFEAAPGESLAAMYDSAITPGYFEAMQAPLLSGRYFDSRDTADAPNVIIVDERLARKYWPGIDPVGKRMYEPSAGADLSAITPRTQWFTVVGVVKEVKLRGLVEGVGENGAYYTAHAQVPLRNLTFAIRTRVAPASVAAMVRTELARLDPELPVFDMQTMDDRLHRSLTTRRASMLLSVVFGAIALFLAAIGIYGVLAFLVTQRTREIGVRLALGSSIAQVFALILREGALLLTAGFLFGGVGAVALSQTIKSQLFGIGTGDPAVLVAASAILALIGIGACLVPARRAARVDPLVALRYE